MILYQKVYDKDCYYLEYVEYDGDSNTYNAVVSERWSITDKKIKAELTDDHHYLRFMDMDGEWKHIPLETHQDGSPKNYDQLNRIGSNPKTHLSRKVVDILKYRFVGKTYTFHNNDVGVWTEPDDKPLEIDFKVLMINVKDSKNTKKQKNRNYEYLAVSFALSKDSKIFNRNIWVHTEKGKHRGMEDVGTAKWLVSLYMKASLKTYFPKGIHPAMHFRFIDWIE
jgi:hypothetical protein